VNFIDAPMIIIPRILFTAVMGSMSKLVSEAAAGGVINYRSYKELGARTTAFFRKKGIQDSYTLLNVALTGYAQMGWFKIVKIERNEAENETTFILDNSAEAETSGETGKTVCHCIQGLLTGIVVNAYGVKAEGREVKCKSKGDEYCEFVVSLRS
jgi:predicted hydrocarbon binding protein